MAKEKSKKRPRLDKKTYEHHLAHLQEELVKLQEWVKQEGLKVVVLFEGRDAAGKGGVIKASTWLLYTADAADQLTRFEGLSRRSVQKTNLTSLDAL